MSPVSASVFLSLIISSQTLAVISLQLCRRSIKTMELPRTCSVLGRRIYTIKSSSEQAEGPIWRQGMQHLSWVFGRWEASVDAGPQAFVFLVVRPGVCLLPPPQPLQPGCSTVRVQEAPWELSIVGSVCWGEEGHDWKALTPTCLPGRGTPFPRSSTRC